MLRLIAIAGLAAALGGCIPGLINSWPDVGGTSPDARQGVLLKLTFDDTFHGYHAFGHDVYFLRPDDPPDSPGLNFPIHHSQFITIPGTWATVGSYHADRFPGDLILVPLKPGHYSGIDVAVWYAASSGGRGLPVRIAAPKPMDSFDVQPGKLTVLGALDVKLDIGLAHQDADGFISDSTYTAAGFTGPDEKAEVLDEALSRPEAEPRGWQSLLDAARGELASAGRGPRP